MALEILQFEADLMSEKNDKKSNVLLELVFNFV